MEVLTFLMPFTLQLQGCTNLPMSSGMEASHGVELWYGWTLELPDEICSRGSRSVNNREVVGLLCVLTLTVLQ